MEAVNREHQFRVESIFVIVEIDQQNEENALHCVIEERFRPLSGNFSFSFSIGGLEFDREGGEGDESRERKGGDGGERAFAEGEH